MSIQTSDYETILTLLRTWPVAHRVALVQDLLETLTPTKHESRQTLPQARGLLVHKQNPPTDAQVAAWLHERRLERYNI